MDADDRSRRAGELFDELVELPSSERAVRLSAIAGDDPALHAEVAALLAADRDAGSFLSTPLQAQEPTLVAEALGGAGETAYSAGERIGAWRLARPLGAGGMGEVWQVERDDGAFEQRAALKLLKRGLDSEDLLRRFRAERQILARLRHPAIAHLYDGGIAPDGRPFFVMELVDGRPLTDPAAIGALSVDDRLRLFVTVCDAVDAAHRALIVHRDLKPSNVLVTAAGEPKLLDFGIAKLLADDGDDGATRVWERVMTPAYAAPEQILGEPVTTATDVYTLGVLLYELLAGRLPHRRSASAAKLADEVTRETPERPSTAVQRAGDPSAAHEQLDAAERERRARRLRGDLDWIVLRALAREPERRYASAAALAADLRRHLDGKPVEARPDSAVYRTAKFVRRHRVAVTAAALIALSLAAGMVLALASARRADRQARRAEQVQEFLVGLFEAADPDRSLGAEVTASHLLDAGVRELERELAGEPEVRGALLDTVARIERRVGRYESAERLARRAIAEHERGAGPGAALDAARARLTLAETIFSRGDFEAAGREYEAVLRQLEDQGDDSPDVARALAGLATAENYAGRNDRALELARRVDDRARRLYGEDSAEAAIARQALGQMHESASRYEQALAEYEPAAATLRRRLGADHPKTAEVELALAELTGYLGDRERALALFAGATAALRRSLGERHIMVAHAQVKQAFVLISGGQHAEAERRLLDALSIYQELDHFDAASCLRMLGHSLLAQGRTAEAAGRFAAAHDLFRERLGDDHLLALVALGNVGMAQVRQGELAAAEVLLRRSVAGLERLKGPTTDELRQPLLSLGEAERGQGRTGDALATHRRALAIAEAVVGPRHVGAANARREIALDLESQSTPAALAEARGELSQAIEIRRQSDPTGVRLAEWLLDSARLAALADDEERRRADLEAALEIQQHSLGADDARTLATRATLERLGARRTG